jgi:hypothetical protein
MLGTVLVVILILALLGAMPRWSHSKRRGYFPSGGLGLLLWWSLFFCFSDESEPVRISSSHLNPLQRDRRILR